MNYGICTDIALTAERNRRAALFQKEQAERQAKKERHCQLVRHLVDMILAEEKDGLSRWVNIVQMAKEIKELDI